MIEGPEIFLAMLETGYPKILHYTAIVDTSNENLAGDHGKKNVYVDVMLYRGNEMSKDTAKPPSGVKFYHTVEFAPGHWTAGWPVIVPIVNMVIEAMRAQDFSGKRVLDIGCRDGALSFEAERLGAASVLGVDYDLPLETTSFLKQQLRSSVRFESRNIYELSPSFDGVFDIVLLPGVIYHLRYPMMALRRMRDLLPDGGLLLVETATFVDGNRLPLMLCPSGQDSPYEPTSCTFFNIKGFIDVARSLGFSVSAHLSLMNLPAYDPVSDGPLPIDRTVFTCSRDRRLDDPIIMSYWDGRIDGPKLPDWTEG